MHHYWTYAEVPNDNQNAFSFVIALKNGSRFMLNGCYFTISKELFVKHPDSDYFRIDLITELDRKQAEGVIKRALDILIYITGVPYELDYLREDADVVIPSIDYSLSKKKIEKITAINVQYGRINAKKELLENILRLYALSVKYTYLLVDLDESFFAMFKVVEKIAKDEFGIECKSADKGYGVIRDMLSDIVQNTYHIKMAENKLDDLAGRFSNEMWDIVFSDIYAKIAWFCERKNIDYDKEILSKTVKLRNKLAHGENIDIMSSDEEYKLILNLSNKFIREKFFTNIDKCWLGTRIVF